MSGNRILIVEDNPGVADYIHTVLTDSGYDVSGIVASGEEAVDKVKELLPDMVLMDIDLAGELNGIEAAAQIDAQFDIPVIYLTGYSDDLLLQQAKITKPYGYLVKPVNLRELIATIEMTFYRHQLEKRLKESSAKYRQQLESLVKDRTAELTKANEQLQREIDERKRTEEALQESNLRLKEALVELDDKNKELESFVYIVSHDLKAPLVSLTGFASVLLNNYKEYLDETGQLYLSRIQTNVEQMGRLIQDLLELSKIGQMVNDYESVDVTKIIRETIETLEIQLKEKGTEVIIQEDLPTIICNRVRIKQVFENLVSNANKFIGEDNSNPRIEIGCHNNQEEFFEFFVKDNGIGIQKEYHEKVFELFARLGNLKVEGTGVGLAIVKKLVESHRGKIWVDSEVEKGATFYFTLPKSGT